MNPSLDRWNRNGFAEEIKQTIPFLFVAYGGRVIPDPRPNANDENMDYLSVASASLVFKFRRWHRENYGIQVAPAFAPTDSYELLDALLLVGPNAQIDRQKLDWDWRYWGKLIEPRFQLLEQVFDEAHFSETKARLSAQ